MKSHTVPKKLLEQFAYYKPSIKANRLWRYEKGRAPYGDASPRSATRIDGHFSDPRDAAKEAAIEARLNVEFEQPVNEFIGQLGYKTFVWSNSHVRKLAAYLTLLFQRSKARREGTKEQLDVIVAACNSIMADEAKLSDIAANWTLDALVKQVRLPRRITSDDVRAGIIKMRDEQLASDHLQHTYAGSIERAMSYIDEGLVNGQWGVLHSEESEPFVIGDAPLVSWIRYENGFRSLGEGIGKPDVEVLLPISPTACLHVLPQVQRTRQVLKPTVLEVNTTQAAFASDFCYTNQRNEGLDSQIQPAFGTVKIGFNAFSVRFKNYDQKIFDSLMGNPTLKS